MTWNPDLILMPTGVTLAFDSDQCWAGRNAQYQDGIYGGGPCSRTGRHSTRDSALAQETHRVAETIADRAIAAHLFAIADAVLRLAYLGDSSNRKELSEALARLGPDWHRHASR